jgi:hypothetical protein
MSEEQTNFKVTDRRLFNPDGSPREVPPEEKAPVEVVASTSPAGIDTTPESTAAAVQPALEETGTRLGSSKGDDAAATDAETELPGIDEPASFANFIMSIASNAASSLGMMDHPVSGKREVDLELGKHWIDVLGMLHDKTRGNLLPQEQQILESLLADLRMQYVSLTNAAPSKPRAYSSRDITGG